MKRSRRPIVPHPQKKRGRKRAVPREAILAAIIGLADENGDVTRNVRFQVAQQFGVSKQVVSLDMNYFAASGELIRVTRGRYHVPGVEPLPVPPPPEPTHGIPVMTTIREHITESGSVRLIPISLARVASLDKAMKA